MASVLQIATSGTMDMVTVANKFNVASNMNDMESIIRPLGSGGTLTVFPDDFYGAVYLGISPASSSKTSSSGSVVFIIVSANPWTASDNASWISLSSTSGSGNSGFTATISANTGSVRTGTITVTSNGESVTATITQSAGVSISSVQLGKNTTAQGACDSYVNNFRTTYYIPSGSSFHNATQLFSNSGGTTNATSGWYSNGDITRNWNGSSFTATDLCLGGGGGIP